MKFENEKKRKTYRIFDMLFHSNVLLRINHGVYITPRRQQFDTDVVDKILAGLYRGSKIVQCYDKFLLLQ